MRVVAEVAEGGMKQFGLTSYRAGVEELLILYLCQLTYENDSVERIGSPCGDSLSCKGDYNANA
jgi:hypothetical protein